MNSKQIVATESPAHIEEVTCRLSYAVGLKRTNSTVKKLVEYSVIMADAAGELRWKDDFFWSEQPVYLRVLRHPLLKNFPKVTFTGLMSYCILTHKSSYT